MAKKKVIEVEKFDPRKYMLLAIEAMKKSIPEPRSDGKVSPKVGAVIVKPNGEYETAFRGELRFGDHAEFTLLERKNRANDLTGSILFATLEPCAPGARRHPKLGCAERIVNARIKQVWVGYADPDPDVDRKGIQYLRENGIIVRMFHRDLQNEIIEENKEFIKQAKDRADGIEVQVEPTVLSPLENPITNPQEDWYSNEAINLYLKNSKSKLAPLSNEFWNHFEKIGMVKKEINGEKEKYIPTGFGILLFGKEPRAIYPQAAVKLIAKYSDGKIIQEDLDLPLVLLPDAIENWLHKVMLSSISRDSSKKKTITEFPIEPLREAYVNALVHRDYDNKQAKTYIELDEEKIIVKSAGLPVDPISLDDVKSFKAPSLSRNPKIAYVFNKLEFMEESEFGMETFRTMNSKFHFPSPIVNYKEPYLEFIFPRNLNAIKDILDIEEIKNLNEEELKGYNWIMDKGTEITAREYAKHFNYSTKTAGRHLNKMLQNELIETNEESIHSPKVRYKIRQK